MLSLIVLSRVSGNARVLVALAALGYACDDAVCPAGTTETNGHCLKSEQAAAGNGSSAEAPGAGMSASGTVTAGGAPSPSGAPGTSASSGSAGNMSSAFPGGIGGTAATGSGPAGSGAVNGAAGGFGAAGDRALASTAGAQGGLAGSAGTLGNASPQAGPPGSDPAAGNAGAGANGPSACVPTSGESCDPRGQDEDCDGTIDEGCECFGADTRECNNAGMGICAEGRQTCTAGTWGRCESTVQPRAEVCDGQPIDEDCDGNPNTGCTCENGQTQDCSTSRPGVCASGTQSCAAGRWGACQSSVTALAAEMSCDDKDEDCDGQVDDAAPCPAGQRCAQGRCVSTCSDAECAEKSTNACRPDSCDENTGTCVAGTPVAANMACQTSSIQVGFCTDGTCMADRDVVCDVGGTAASQWKFNDDYRVCEPGTCLSSAGFTAFGPCRTAKSGQAVVWDIFDDGGNNNGIEVTTLSGRDKKLVCDASGGCKQWFGNPRVKSSGAPIECTIFDDGGGSPVGPERQFAPWYHGDNHPSVTDVNNNYTLCTPGACRKWIGNCRVR